MARGYPDFEGDKSALYLQPEWAAKEATDKTLIASNTDAGFHESGSVLYTVPAEKTLYTTAMSIHSQIAAAADYDHFAYVAGLVAIEGGSAGTIGGLGGGSVSLPTPIVTRGGEQIVGLVVNNSNVTCSITLTLWGYEV